MDKNKNQENAILDVLKDPEDLERSIRSIRRYSARVDNATDEQKSRLNAIIYLSERLADDAERLELNSVMGEDELDRVEDIVEIAAWSCLQSMRLLHDEIVDSGSSEDTDIIPNLPLDDKEFLYCEDCDRAMTFAVHEQAWQCYCEESVTREDLQDGNLGKFVIREIN